MSGAILPLPNTPSCSGAWLKHRDNFTFTFIFYHMFLAFFTQHQYTLAADSLDCRLPVILTFSSVHPDKRWNFIFKQLRSLPLIWLRVAILNQPTV